MFRAAPVNPYDDLVRESAFLVFHHADRTAEKEVVADCSCALRFVWRSEKATNEDLLSEDWETNLLICDKVQEEGENG
jgi:hypothetical protein